MFWRLLPGSTYWFRLLGRLPSHKRTIQGWSRDRLFQVSSARLFRSTSQFDYCVHACANQPSQMGNAPLVSEQRLPIDPGVGAPLPSSVSVTMTSSLVLLLQILKKTKQKNPSGIPHLAPAVLLEAAGFEKIIASTLSVRPDEHPEEAV